MTAVQMSCASPPRDLFVPTLECERLVLRAPRLADAPAIAALANNRKIAEMTTSIPHPYRLEDAEAWITGLPGQEPGVTFAELLRVFLPRGYLFPVSPGTAYTTIGGAVANDIHGKNHHRDGSFTAHVVALTLDTPSGRYPLDKDVSLAIAAQLQRIGIKVNVVVNEWGTHLDKIKNRNTGEMFFLGWGPSLYGQGVMEPLFKADQTYSSYGHNKVIDDKIARAVTVVDAKGRAAAYADLQQLVRDEAAWVPLWQQHDLYGVANWIEWTPRADEKVWMYEARGVAR